ncbi:biopolymer transporter ExbD [Achromobacter sp. F4_2707]|uniref:ExbD/TolR family protein n=1 Tax=Achromobacter sp. F4_2707 TaxID=3114286 RepID=UPI0039C6961E
MAFGSFDNKSSSNAVSEINMVPLIDVMLVLLVIFIITAPLLSHSIKINVPQASSEPVQQDPKVVDFAVDADGQLFWNEQPVSMEQIPALMAAEAALDPQPEIRLRADLDTRYEVLAQVMSMARQSGLKRLGFVTRPGSTPAAAPGPVADTPAAMQAQGAGS